VFKSETAYGMPKNGQKNMLKSIDLKTFTIILIHPELALLFKEEFVK